jgi:pyruvate dehydrogenase E2 component (dihydrolipoamide acetyltransferase)
MADKIIKEVITPDLGMDHPVPIAEIFIEIGQSVKKEDPLLSLESEKAVMDLPSPYEGVIKEILVKVDQEISSGTALMTIELAEEDEAEISDNDEKKDQKEDLTEDPEQRHENKEQKEDSPEPEMNKKETKEEQETPEKNTSHDKEETSPGKSHASPSVRLYARELSVDLSQVSGTGPKGRVRREDVQNFVKEAVKGSSSGGTGLPAAPYVDPAQFGEVREEKLTGIQKITGTHLHSAWVNIPHVTHFDKADITELEKWRKELNEAEKKTTREGGPRKYTSLAFVVKALTRTMQEYPRFNSVLAPGGDSLLIRDYYNVAVAVDTPRGLLVPVIKDTDKKGIGQIADEIIALAGKGRDGKLKPEDLKGASISISNLGGIGGTSFTPIINPPEVAILGLSRAIMEPVWNGEEFVPRLMLPLSLSYDHRVIDGALAAEFSARLAAILSDLRTILL